MTKSGVAASTASLLPRPGSITFTAFSCLAMVPVKAVSKSGAAVPTTRSPRPSWIKIAAAPASIVTTRFGGADSFGSRGQAGAALMFIPPLPDDAIPGILAMPPVPDADAEAEPMSIPAMDDDLPAGADEGEPEEQAARATVSAADGISATRNRKS